MSLRRRIDTLGPPLLAAAAVAVLVAPTLAGPARSRMLGHLPIRSASGPTTLPMCRPDTPASGDQVATLRGAAWYRLDPILDAAGGLGGQRLVVGQVGRRGGFELPLAVESFASGPSGGRILVGSDDGRSSVRPDRRRSAALLGHRPRGSRPGQAGCLRRRRAAASSSSVSTVDPAPTSGSGAGPPTVRGRLGCWSRSARTSGSVASSPRVFPGALDGRRLVVTSCGEAACLARIVDRATGRVMTVDDPRIGEVIGLVGDDLVAYGGCPGLPCEIVVMNLRTGRIRDLATLAGLATVSAVEKRGVRRLRGLHRARPPSPRAPRWDCRVGPSRSTRACDSCPARIGRWRESSSPPASSPSPRVAAPGVPTRPATFVNLADGRRLPAVEIVR